MDLFDKVLEEETKAKPKFNNIIINQNNNQKNAKDEYELIIQSNGAGYETIQTWKLPKKNKIIIISICVVILLLIIGLVIFLVTNKKHDGKDELPSVVLAKDNYRYENGVLTILDDNDNTIGKNSIICS